MLSVHGPQLRQVISHRLAAADAVVICAVGNDFRGDDAVGILVGRAMMESGPIRRTRVLICGELPENYLSEIMASKPSHVVLVDAASTGKPPGSIVLVEHDEIYGGTISTHRLPLSFLAKLIAMKSQRTVDVFVLGIQVGQCDFGSEVSGEVRRAATALGRILVGVLNEEQA